MTKGKSTSGRKSATSEKSEFEYTFDKLNKAVDKCDENALEWAMASVRSNEKSLHKGDIMEDTYMDRSQKISSLVSGFSYNCRCSPKTSTMML